jgi:hypothetical protein
MRNRPKLLWLGLLLVAIIPSNTLTAGGSTMKLSKDEEAQIRKAVEAIEDEQAVAVLKGDSAALRRFWDQDFTVNAPHNQIVEPRSEILKRVEQRTGLQYSSLEVHREATVIRRDCVVTMGYEIVVPKGDVPDSGKTINRRYTNIYYFDDGGWRLIARQATNISVK